jgi:membrane-bound lytic murein transglycosylase A
MSHHATPTGNLSPPMTMNDVLKPIAFNQVKGWSNVDLSLSLATFQRSSVEILRSASGFRRETLYGGRQQHWQMACSAAASVTDAKLFFETYFRPFRVTDLERPEGLFTGYYEPLVQGSLQPSPDYPVPVYARPSDLVAFTETEIAETGLSYGRRIKSKAKAYDTREQIENGSLNGKAEIICWLTSWVDAFFMHVQGQGRVALQDGGQIRLSYAAKAGHPYTGIGHVLVEEGVATKEKMSMQVLRDWMSANPSAARKLMWQNKSYIFFQCTDVSDTELGGIGAAKVNLTPGRSLAIDRRYWMFGTPLWIETTKPPEITDSRATINQLMIAQDTGTAIRGLVRGDFFWGWGDDAAHIAGHMKSSGNMIALLPVPLALQWGHNP